MYVRSCGEQSALSEFGGVSGQSAPNRDATRLLDEEREDIFWRWRDTKPDPEFNQDAGTGTIKPVAAGQTRVICGERIQ